MFEKIGNAAEKLATNVSESRRGFLVRVGQAALGVAGVFAGLLALRAEAQALRVTNNCELDDSGHLDGVCIDNRRGTCTRCFTRDCPAGRREPPSSLRLCGIKITSFQTCRCFH